MSELRDAKRRVRRLQAAKERAVWLRNHFKNWGWPNLLKTARRQLQQINQALRKGRGRVKRLSVSSRVKPNVVVVRMSPNKSGRSSSIRLIVLHSTESKPYAGSGDLESLGNWFARSDAGVSSHVATDDDGNSGRYVPDADKAWHVGNFNSPSLGIEQIGYASQTSWPSKQLDETARWIALWSKAYDIPIQRGQTSGCSVTRDGVVTHGQLGCGNDHWDPGPAYPFDDVLRRAKRFRDLL